jgi:hypothetical protein
MLGSDGLCIQSSLKHGLNLTHRHSEHRLLVFLDLERLVGR